MNKHIAIILICLLSPLATRAHNLDSLYHAIDEAINNSDIYLRKKIQQIDSLRTMADKQNDPKLRFDALLRLYEAYSAYQNDSAMSTLHRALHLAENIGQDSLKNLCYITIVLQHSISGFYNEAAHYLGTIHRAELPTGLLPHYYRTRSHLYGEMARYTQDNSLSHEYYRSSDLYLDSLISITPTDSETYLEYLENQHYKAHKYEEALKTNDQRMQLAQPGTHEYAKVSYFRAMDFLELGKTEECKKWLAQSALCDIKNSVMDQASLWSLADMLNEEGDIERSHRYVEYSWRCTSKFSGHVRTWLVSPVITMINDRYKEKLSRANTRLWILAAAASLLALLMAAMYLYVSKKRRQLATARNQLKTSNDNLTIRTQELSDANSRLSALNSQLTTLNSQLKESNRVKEEYIGKFFSLCSEYINKLDQYRIMVKRKIKARQFEDLARVSNDEQMKEEELSLLYTNFDSIFLHIFPTFMDDFNSLLKPEHRIPNPEKGKLHTDARIFALIRLGIEDSSKIAEFLHYSPNTIYNYRARLKSKAIDRDNFEEQIKRISSTE